MSSESAPRDLNATGAARAGSPTAPAAPESRAARRKPQALPASLRLMFFVSLLLSLGAGGFFISDVIGMRQTAAALDRDRVLAQRLETMLTTLLDAETGERGFLLTGRPEYLEPYARAVQEYRSNLAALHALANGDAELQQPLAGFDALVEDKLTELARSIDMYWRQGAQAALRTVLTGGGKRTMDEIRAGITAARSVVETRVASAAAAADSRNTVAFVVALIAGGINTILFIVLYRAVSAYSSERDRAQDALRDSSALLRSVTEGTGDWIFAKDRGGRLILANQPVFDAFGKKEDEILGKTALDYVPDRAEAEAIYASDMRVMNSGRGERAETTLTLGGSVHTFIATRNPRLDGEGRVVGLVGSSSDITARKEAERELQHAHDDLAQTVASRTAELSELSQHLMRISEQEKERLAAELHDELGSLLTVISMDAERVLKQLRKLDPELAERQQNIVQLVHETANVKRRIVDGLRPRLLEEFGLLPALREYLRQWSESSAVSLIQELPKAIAEPSSDVALALYRVVQESLTNVSKYARAGTVAVRLAEVDGKIVLTVEDDGIGISDDVLSKPGVHGVSGMRERVAGFGGRFEIGRGPRGGTQVTAIFPLQGNVATG